MSILHRRATVLFTACQAHAVAAFQVRDTYAVVADSGIVHEGHVQNQLLANSTDGVEYTAHSAAQCRQVGIQGSRAKAPFDFWVTDSTRASAAEDPHSSGLCAYPMAASACAAGNKCCGAASWVTHGNQTSLQLLIWIGSAFTAMYIHLLSRKPASSIHTVIHPVAIEASRFQSKFEDKSPLAMLPFHLGCACLQVSGAIMAISTQIKLRPTDRNAMLAADAFLNPLADIFQFLEDSITVQIGYAIAAGDARLSRAVLAVGITGGFILGTLAATLTTALSFWPAAIEALIAPDAKFHISGCGLVPQAAQMAREVHGYWILRSWSWPANFAGMAFTGMLLASGHLSSLAFAWMLSASTRVAVWLLGLRTMSSKLDALGLSGFLSAIVFLAACWISTLLNPPALGRKAAEPAQTEAPRTSAWSEGPLFGLIPWRSFELIGPKACRQGLQAMSLELCVQFAISLGIYLGGSMGLGPMYQVSAMQSAMPLYGVAFSTGIGMMMKTVGSMLVGCACFHMYSFLADFAIFWSFLFALLSFFTALPFRTELAFAYGEPGCIYGSDPACLQVYASIFGQGHVAQGSLPDTFSAFAFAASAMSLFTALKTALYSCSDFAFMAKVGIATLVLVYLPAVVVARFVMESTKALYAAMYLPMMTLALIFLIRLKSNSRRMLAGETGPWTQNEADSKSAA